MSRFFLILTLKEF